MKNANRKFVLAARPDGAPAPEDFRLETEPLPEPERGEVLIRSMFLSVDPYMRGRMNAGPSYAAPIRIGEVMVGGGVGEIVQSTVARFNIGEIVVGPFGWQEFSTQRASQLRKLDPLRAPVTTALGVLGMPGLTAYFGFLDVGRPQPGETVVVSAAAGAVGATVGQIAKLKGCRAVGFVGSDQKARYLLDELDFDAAINYRTTSDLSAALAEACPHGIDVYFDNVGGEATLAVFDHINVHARLVICGQIASYNSAGSTAIPGSLRFMVVKRARMEGILVTDFADRYDEGYAILGEWFSQGMLKAKDDIMDGFENMPRAFMRLFSGENFGKQLVKV